METIIVTTESAIEKIMERVLDKKLPKPPESDVDNLLFSQKNTCSQSLQITLYFYF